MLLVRGGLRKARRTDSQSNAYMYKYHEYSSSSERQGSKFYARYVQGSAKKDNLQAGEKRCPIITNNLK